jgi:hypothetical protein
MLGAINFDDEGQARAKGRGRNRGRDGGGIHHHVEAEAGMAHFVFADQTDRPQGIQDASM